VPNAATTAAGERRANAAVTTDLDRAPVSGQTRVGAEPNG
jgi:hypothetical protein